MQEGNEEPFNVRLHLAKDILTIQEQDVICVSGEPFYSSVSDPVRLFTSSRIEISIMYHTVSEGYSTQTLRTCVNDKSSSVHLFLINQMQLLNDDSPIGSWRIECYI